MFRIDSEGNDNGKFTGGDPLIPTPATLITPEWMNAVQEELALTIEGLGGTLVKGTNNQLLARLNARYGRLDLANTWTGNQSVGGTLGVTGNVSLGGALAVTASTTLAGPLTANGTATFNNDVTISSASRYPLTVLGSDSAHAIAYFGSGTPLIIRDNAPGIGFNFIFDGSDRRPVAGYSSDIYQDSGSGDLRFRIGGTGAAGSTITAINRFRIVQGAAATATTPAVAVQVESGYLKFDAVNPNSNVGFANTLTPTNIVKVHGKITTNGTGGGSVASGGSNIASVTASGNTVTVNFTQKFTDANFTATITMHGSVRSVPTVTAQTDTSVSFEALDLSPASGSTSSSIVAFGTTSRTFSITCLGAQ
jgi:hypothetical protein